MLSKRGQGGLSMDSTGFILLAIVGAIVILSVMVIVFNQDEAFENWACKASVYFSDQTGGEGDFIPYLDVNPILCRTHYAKLENKEDLAERMTTTWRIWGEGNLDPSGTNWLIWSRNMCFQQYRGEVFEELVGVTKEEFENYLKSNGESKSKNTYWNFFNKGAAKNNIFVNFDVLNEGDFVAILYFEEVELTIFNPLSLIYDIRELIVGEDGDRLVIMKEDLKNPIDCQVIE